MAVAVLAALLLAGMGHPIQDDNEGLYARVASEMLGGASWIVPHLDGVPYLEKPPLLYWLTALAFRAFGETEIAARLPSVLGALLSLSAVFVFAIRRWDARTALLSSLVCASFPLFVGMSRLLMFDMLFTGLLAWALVALHESARLAHGARWIRLSYALLALAVLTKGLLALVVYGTVAVVMALAHAEERGRLRRSLLDPAAIALFLLLAVPWHLAAWFREPGFAWFYFLNEHVLRFLGMREPKDFYQGPWWYYLPRLLAASLPWAVLLLVPMRGSDGQAATRRFLWSWLLVPLLFFSISVAKANYYMIVALPALSLLLGRRLAMLGHSRWAMVCPVSWPGLLAVGAAVGAPLAEPYRWPPSMAPLLAVALAFAVMSLALYLARRPLEGAIACAAFSIPLAMLFSHALEANEDQDSARRVAREIQRGRFDEVFAFRDFESMSSLAFYLRRPIGVIDTQSNDLRFGIALRPDARRFPDDAQFVRTAQRGEVAIVVTDARRAALEHGPLARGLHHVSRVGRPPRDHLVASIQRANESMNLRRNSRVSAFVTCPSASTSFATPPMYASGCCIAGMSRNTSDWRRWWLAPNAESAPGDTLTTAAGLRTQALLPYGREPTSMAFLSAPGTERLYSGVTKRTPSAAPMRARKSCHSRGGESVSRSWL
jgi:4-amino-4-deoxy-L-arabinose transferase-like glycosyltransferase